MKVGDLVRCASHVPAKYRWPTMGIITCVDPEEIGDNDEVEVLWTSGFADRSNHSTWQLEVLSENR